MAALPRRSSWQPHETVWRRFLVVVVVIEIGIEIEIGPTTLTLTLLSLLGGRDG